MAITDLIGASLESESLEAAEQVSRTTEQVLQWYQDLVVAHGYQFYWLR